MYGMQLLQSVAVTLALLGNVHCLTPLSGKCRTDDLKPVSLDGLPVNNNALMILFCVIQFSTEISSAGVPVMSADTGHMEYSVHQQH